MSALGQTCAAHKPMSALHPKADMCSALGDVRFVPKADICSAQTGVRFTAGSRHVQCDLVCPLCAKSGHHEFSTM